MFRFPFTLQQPWPNAFSLSYSRLVHTLQSPFCITACMDGRGLWAIIQPSLKVTGTNYTAGWTGAM